MSGSRQVLIASADPAQRTQLGKMVEMLGVQYVDCTSLSDARAEIDRQTLQMVLCGDDLPDSNLRTAVRVLTSATGGVPVIVLSHLAEWDAYLKALDAGAFDYIACPPDPVETRRIFRLALGEHPPLGRASHTAA